MARHENNWFGAVPNNWGQAIRLYFICLKYIHDKNDSTS